jgi:oligosaccharide repeat unit polymerase
MNVEAQIGQRPGAALPLNGPLKISLSLSFLLIGYLLIELQVLPALQIPTLLLLLASASFLLVKGHGKVDLLNPVRVFGSLWCFCLALGNMRLLPTVSAWSSLMWECMLTGLVAFVAGFWIGTQITPNSATGLSLEASDVDLAQYILPTKKTLIVAGICLLIGTSILAYEDFLIGGVPILADNPDVLRTVLFGGNDPRLDTLSIKLLHFFVECLKYGVFLIIILLFQKTRKSRKVIVLSILMILFGVLVYGSQGGRMFFVTIAITCGVIFHYLRRRIRLVEICSATVILFLFVGIFGSIRINQSESAPLFQQALKGSSLPDGQFWEGIAFAYATATVSFEVFYRFTEDLRTMQRPSGGYLFYSLHRFIPRANLGEVAGELYSGESVTSTFLGDFYGDYGYWGVLFGPLVMGLLYGWAYSQGGRQNPIYWIYVRAMLLQMLVFFPYVICFLYI